MKKTIYNYFFHEIIRYFVIVIFATTAIIWTVQAVNFLDLVTDDGHAFMVYILYSSLTIPKIITKLIPFSFLIALLLTILKLEKDNELIILWMSGLNKIHIVNLIFRISILVMFIHLLMSAVINPKILNFSRTILKDSELQFASSLLKEREFNDSVKGLTVFVDKKKRNNTYENIFMRDDGQVLTQISDGPSTIFAKAGYVTENKENLVLLNGNIQKTKNDGTVTIIKFEKTAINITGLSTRSTIEPKIQETSTIDILKCVQEKNLYLNNCIDYVTEKNIESKKQLLKENKIEINKRFGTPFFIPLISLISCFLLSSRRDKKYSNIVKYLCFLIGFMFLIGAEIMVRYSGVSWNHTAVYYLVPIGFLPLIYFFLIKSFKYENLN